MAWLEEAALDLTDLQLSGGRLFGETASHSHLSLSKGNTSLYCTFYFLDSLEAGTD